MTVRRRRSRASTWWRWAITGAGGGPPAAPGRVGRRWGWSSSWRAATSRPTASRRRPPATWASIWESLVPETAFRLAATRSLRSGALSLDALRSEDSASRLTERHPAEARMFPLILSCVLCLADDLAELRGRADKGDANAMFELGMRHHNGEGVEKDDKAAL